MNAHSVIFSYVIGKSDDYMHILFYITVIDIQERKKT